MNSTCYVGKFSDSGSQNSFYTISHRKCGFKSFPNKSLATFSHAVQTDLARLDLAPRVYSQVGRINIPNYYVDKKFKTQKQLVLSNWGYLTEIAKPFSCNNLNCDEGCLFCYSGCKKAERIEELLDKIESLGLNYHDAHNGNLGYVTRGKKRVLVIIDVGAESIIDEEGIYPDVCWDGAEDIDCQCEKCLQKYGGYDE